MCSSDLTNAMARLRAQGSASSIDFHSSKSTVSLQSDTRALLLGARLALHGPRFKVTTDQGSADIDAVSDRSLTMGGHNVRVLSAFSSRSKAVELSAHGGTSINSARSIAIRSHITTEVKSTNAGKVDVTSARGRIIMSSPSARTQVRALRVSSDVADSGLTLTAASTGWSSGSVDLTSGMGAIARSSAALVGEAKGGPVQLTAGHGALRSTGGTLRISAAGSTGSIIAGATAEMQVEAGTIELHNNCGVLKIGRASCRERV